MVEIKPKPRSDLPLAVVVGAGGLGLAVARRLGQLHRLVLVDRNAEHLDNVAQMLRRDGYDLVTAPCDVTDPSAVASVAALTKTHGPLRVLAHVVGLSPSAGDWRAIMAVDLIGAALMADAMLPLATAGTAAIFVGSLAAHREPPGESLVHLLDHPLDPGFLDRLEAAAGPSMSPALAYRLAKWALVRMCRRRAAQWGARGARILSISPGLIATPMGALEFKAQPVKGELLAKTPLGREGSMLEIAEALEFLASDRASFISGIDLLVDGGVCAALQFPD